MTFEQIKAKGAEIEDSNNRMIGLVVGLAGGLLSLAGLYFACAFFSI